MQADIQLVHHQIFNSYMCCPNALESCETVLKSSFFVLNSQTVRP